TRFPLSDEMKLLGEVSYRNAAWAGLIALEDKRAWSGWFSSRIKLQGRYYGLNFAEGFARRIEHDVISYDTETKDFLDSANIFAVDDDVTTFGIIANFYLKLSSAVSLFSENEFASL